jgi:uncharacterized phage protein (TIGR02218 family)
MTLAAHLGTGTTTIARAWAVSRRDGVVLGFTDHDRSLSFDGITFRPEAGMAARAVQSGTGLAVDNSEALGVLSAGGLDDADIAAGLYDGTEVRLWWVNWAEPTQNALRFRGTIGEIRRGDGAFRAELRGLTEALNRPGGRVYHRQCGAVLGDQRCGFDLEAPGFSETRSAELVDGARIFRFGLMDLYEDRWFERGTLRVTSGAAAGLTGVIKADRRLADGGRVLHLWQPLARDVLPGDGLRIEPGCDKRAATCREKFGNLLNFRGFPFIPGEDWLMAVPKGDGTETGGSLSR